MMVIICRSNVHATFGNRPRLYLSHSRFAPAARSGVCNPASIRLKVSSTYVLDNDAFGVKLMCAKTIGPSSAMCSLSRMAGAVPRNNCAKASS